MGQQRRRNSALRRARFEPAVVLLAVEWSAGSAGCFGSDFEFGYWDFVEVLALR